MSTSVDEVIEFLSIVGEKGFLNSNTTVARQTACRKFFDILDPDQKNVEYVRDNLDVIKARFSNLNKDVAGKTVDEYARRVQLVLNDFTAWSEDRGGWEKAKAAKQSARPAGDAEKKPRPQSDRTREQPRVNGADHSAGGGQNPEARVVSFPIREGNFELQVTMPKAGLTIAELRKVAYFLLPYTTDWEPTEAPRDVFPMLESRDARP